METDTTPTGRTRWAVRIGNSEICDEPQSIQTRQIFIWAKYCTHKQRIVILGLPLPLPPHVPVALGRHVFEGHQRFAVRVLHQHRHCTYHTRNRPDMMPAGIENSTSPSRPAFTGKGTNIRRGLVVCIVYFLKPHQTFHNPNRNAMFAMNILILFS